MNPGADRSEVRLQTAELEQESVCLAGETTDARQSRLISRVLSPAIRFWLRSQLDHVEELQFSIQTGDRRLLSGAIDQVMVSAHKAVYQGLHLSDIRLTGSGIRTNLGQVLRGKPLRLLQAFPVAGELRLHTADLNASLQSPLLGRAVLDFLASLLQPQPQPTGFQSATVVLETGKLTFSAMLLFASGDAVPVTLSTGLRVEQGNQLHLDRPTWRTQTQEHCQELDSIRFNLGAQVLLEALTLECDRLVCRGQIMVTPGESDDQSGA